MRVKPDLPYIIITIVVTSISLYSIISRREQAQQTPPRATPTATVPPASTAPTTLGTATTWSIQTQPAKRSATTTLIIGSDDEPVATMRADGTFEWRAQCIVSMFQPKADISARDIARLLPFIQGACMTDADWKALKRTRRHLHKMDLSICDPCTDSEVRPVTKGTQ